MFSALLIIICLAVIDLGKLKGLVYRPLSQILFYIFALNFVVLMVLGANHVEFPFIDLGQFSTALYFIYFIIILPLIGILENIFTSLQLMFIYQVSDNIIYPTGRSTIKYIF